MTPYRFAVAALIGMFASAGIFHFVIWFLSRRERVLIAFAAQCFCFSFLFVCLAFIVDAETIAAAQRALDQRTNASLAALIFTVWILRSLAGDQGRWFALTTTGILLFLLTLNVLGPPLNGRVLRVDRLTLPWGEQISVLSKDSNRWLVVAAYAVASAIYLFGLVCAARLYRRDRIGGSALGTVSALALIFLLPALLIDVNQTPWPYVAAIPNVLWAPLVSWQIAREHRATRVRAQESEQTIRAVFDHAVQFIGLLKTDGTLIEANRAALDFAGTSAAEVIGKPFWETPWWRHSPDLQSRLRNAVAAAGRGETVRFEATHPGTDGALHTIDFSLTPVRDRGGSVILLVPEGRDISDAIAAAKERKASEARLAAVIANSPNVAIQWYDRDGRVTLWNGASERMFGFSSTEAVGKTLDQLIHTPQEYELFVTTLAQIARTGEPVGPLEYHFRRRDGEARTCLSTLFSIPGPDSTHWFVCMDVDITEQKQSEQKAREQLEELQRWHRLTVGREDRVLQLKREVNDLCRQMGLSGRYESEPPTQASTSSAAKAEQS